MVVPKQKFDMLSNSKDIPKDTKSVSCQTEFYEPCHVENKTEEKTENANTVTTQRVKDGIPGELNRRQKQRQKSVGFLINCHF